MHSTKRQRRPVPQLLLLTLVACGVAPADRAAVTSAPASTSMVRGWRPSTTAFWCAVSRQGVQPP